MLKRMASAFQIFLHGIMILMILTSCTEDSKVKELALKQAVLSLEKELRAEANALVHGKEALKINYVSVILDRSQFEDQKITVFSDAEKPRAQAQVLVKTIPDSVRNALLEIIEKRKTDNSFSFNIADALGLVRKQMGVGAEEFSQIVFTLQMEKNIEGWTVTGESKEKKASGP